MSSFFVAERSQYKSQMRKIRGSHYSPTHPGVQVQVGEAFAWREVTSSGGASPDIKTMQSCPRPSSSSVLSWAVFGRFVIMGFGDLKSASGLKLLNDFLSDRSYIEGWEQLCRRYGSVLWQLPAARPSWLTASRKHHGAWAFWCDELRFAKLQKLAINSKLQTLQNASKSKSLW